MTQYTSYLHNVRAKHDDDLHTVAYNVKAKTTYQKSVNENNANNERH